MAKKTVEVPQLPWGGAMICSTVAAYYASVQGRLLDKKSGFLRVSVESAPVVDSRPALLLE